MSVVTPSNGAILKAVMPCATASVALLANPCGVRSSVRLLILA
jgi:hypothetical protein